MKIRIAAIACIVLAISIVSSCSKKPQHADYIPKDASAVLSIHTDALIKKLAWEVIWNSKLMEEMKRKSGEKDPSKSVEEMGIKLMTTHYLYVKADKRYSSGSKVVAIVPLDNKEKWEAYVKKNFNGVNITKQNDRNEALLNDNMYAGWTADVLIITNTILPSMDEIYNQLQNIQDPQAYDSVYSTLLNQRKPDATLMALEMNKTFAKDNKNAVTQHESFNKVASAGHDISLWLNYENLMTNYAQSGMGGLALTGALWKDAAATMGIDFEDGKIEGTMQYYASKEMQAAYKEFNKNVDKQTIENLPTDNLNMIAAANLSPKGMRMIIEKMGTAGLLNTALAQTGITADDIFNAIDGDMAFAMNDFRMYPETIPANTYYPGQEAMTTTGTDVSFTFAMKMGQKESFDKVFAALTKDMPLTATATGGYMISTGKDSFYISKEGGYLTVSNKEAFANGYAKATFKGQKKPEVVKNMNRHAGSMYVDIRGLMQQVVSGNTDEKDREMLALTGNLLQDIDMHGGGKSNIFEYKIYLNFVNKKENSLLQLLNFSGKMIELSEKEEKPMPL
ncbi:hypothetical protein CAP35_03905 [Chitinophagaceae bacterium IBVUCB1]|nr:hypothetical protein CAP35_03905 [Chitinophagaceae bacterium IBVUCB1]